MPREKPTPPSLTTPTARMNPMMPSRPEMNLILTKPVRALDGRTIEEIQLFESLAQRRLNSVTHSNEEERRNHKRVLARDAKRRYRAKKRGEKLRGTRKDCHCAVCWEVKSCLMVEVTERTWNGAICDDCLAKQKDV